jgi:nucleoside-triphosphatase
MDMSAPNILLTGPPGCGKTTIIRKVAERLPMPVEGFFTEDVRGRDGQRIGFDVVMLDGRRGPLARVGSSGPRVGRYGVSLHYLEEFALPALARETGYLVVLDEIGKMECFSVVFQQVARSLLDGLTSVLGTVALGGCSFIREVRSRRDVELVEVTLNNREGMVENLIKRFDV